MTRRRLAGAISTIAVVAAALPSAASSAPGDVYVSEQDNPSNGALIRVNPVNGARSILTETGNPIGPGFDDPLDVEVDLNGDLLMAAFDGADWGPFEVDSGTGARRLITMSWDLRTLEVAPTGVFFAGAISDIFTVDRATGGTSLVSGGARGSGPALTGIRSISVAADGSLLVSDEQLGLVRVSQFTGDRTVVAAKDVPPPGEDFGQMGGIAVVPGGLVLLADADKGLFVVNPVNGARLLYAPNDGPGSSTDFGHLLDVALGPGTDAFLLDANDDSARKGVYKVVLNTGARFAVSTNADDYGDANFVSPSKLAVAPSPIPSQQPVIPGLRDLVPPLFESASLTRTRFRVDRAGDAEVRIARRRARRGTRFVFRLSEAALVRFRIERKRAGRRFRGRCRRPAPANRGRRRCTRYVHAGTFAATAVQGLNSKRFSGKIGRKRLRPGRYRASLVARDLSSNRSSPVRLSFRIVRR